MLLTLVIVELTLCAPESSIGSFPNFSLIIGDMALLFLRGGACSGTLKKKKSQTTLQKSEKEREAYFSYVSIEMRNFLFQLFANFCFFFSTSNKVSQKNKKLPYCFLSFPVPLQRHCTANVVSRNHFFLQNFARTQLLHSTLVLDSLSNC